MRLCPLNNSRKEVILAKDKDKDYAPTRNSAERQASADYMSESISSGKDPIPKEAPDWAKDIPSPSDSEPKK